MLVYILLPFHVELIPDSGVVWEMDGHVHVVRLLTHL